MPTVYNKVTINGTTYIDLSQDTVANASHIRQGYTGHLNDGTQVTGTYSGGSPNLQAKTNINPTTSSQTIQPDSGYDGLSSVQINAMPTGAATVSATKGTVSNHSVQVTPNAQVTQAGYISAGAYPGTAVTVSASELVSGSETKTANGTYDVTNLAELVVNVAASGGKAVQIAPGVGRVNVTAYTAVSGQSITVAKTGKYDVYWTGYRSSTSGTSGSQLYIGDNAYGSAQTTFNSTYTNFQNIHLTNVSLTADQVITVRARARNTSSYMYIQNLTIIEA